MNQTLLKLAITALLAASAAQAAERPADPIVTDIDQTPPTKDTDKLEEIRVTAVPLNQRSDDMIAPVSVLAGAALDDARANTLGATVAKEIGIQTTYFGPGVGRPVIRGLDGPRVGVLSNGEGSGDVSTVSQDHAVAIEPFLADQIEILKGPSTLLYGSGAIGGVVNVVDGRIPEKPLDQAFSGRVELHDNSVSNERTGMARIDAQVGNFALHFEGVDRDTDDYDGPDGKIANSYVKTRTGTAGASWVGEIGFLGFAFARYLDTYGNPAEPGDRAMGEPGVHLRMKQTRHDLKGRLNAPLPGIDSLRASFSHTDYEHTEFEAAKVGTLFLSDTNEGRIELVHAEAGGWRGAFGAQLLRRQFQAIGEESFVPQTLTRAAGVFGMEQREFGPLKLELGARMDRQSSDPAGESKRDFTPLSMSAGLSYKFDGYWHLSLNFDRAQRAPAEEELFANGPHAATDAFEIGLPEARKETANQAELGLHYHGKIVEAKVAAYINGFSDYIYLADTGGTVGDLPVRQWSQADARFHGIEGEAKFKLADSSAGRYDLRVWGDTVRAKLADGEGNLPRIAPARVGADFAWSADMWRAHVGVARYFKQNKIAQYETPTDGYTLINAHLSYAIDNGGATSWEAFLDGTNLTNQVARLSTSYIKDVVPLPGRGIAFGVRAFF